MQNSIHYKIKLGGINERIFDIKKLITSILSNTYYNNFEIHIHYEDNVNNEIQSYITNLDKHNIICFKYKNPTNYTYL